MTKEEAEAPDLVLEGLWYMEETDTTTVFDFTTPGVMKAIGYEVADFAENGMDAEAKATVEFPYVAEAEYIVVDMDDTTVVFYVTFAEGSIELDDGNEAILLEEYVPVVPEVSEEESSEDVPSEPEESSEDEESEEASAETPATSTAESSADTSAAPAEDGDSTLLIVIIAVVAVVIIGAVVFIVIKRKK
jgi:cobalamin biosynthesis Mg chelatase CobN